MGEIIDDDDSVQHFSYLRAQLNSQRPNTEAARIQNNKNKHKHKNEPINKKKYKLINVI
jgi:hypothetical protein